MQTLDHRRTALIKQWCNRCARKVQRTPARQIEYAPDIIELVGGSSYPRFELFDLDEYFHHAIEPKNDSAVSREVTKSMLLRKNWMIKGTYIRALQSISINDSLLENYATCAERHRRLSWTNHSLWDAIWKEFNGTHTTVVIILKQSRATLVQATRWSGKQHRDRSAVWRNLWEAYLSKRSLCYQTPWHSYNIFAVFRRSYVRWHPPSQDSRNSRCKYANLVYCFPINTLHSFEFS